MKADPSRFQMLLNEGINMDGALESVLSVVDSSVVSDRFVIVSAAQTAPDPEGAGASQRQTHCTISRASL
jgi:hypothetical protein